MNEKYFHKIDTLDKAYWLGFLFADGNVRKDLHQLKLSQHVQDIDHIHQFCACLGILDPKINVRGNLARLWISRKQLCVDLVNHGCIPNKSKVIRLPELQSRPLYLSFILGYYDGDGKTQSTLITSGSREFLEDIKSHFALPFKLRTEHRITYHDGRTRTSLSTAHELSLGAPLFNEMMANYPNSLSKKRKTYDLTHYPKKYLRHE
ncbi:MAG: hypothetical protein ACTSRK_18715 [Promethearchaeota archaeon]